MTTEQAKQKRCCQVDPVQEVTALHQSQELCIATECMAWRWHRDAMEKGNDGFCGLAGKEGAE